MTHEPRVFLNRKLTRTQSWSFIYMLPVGVFAQKWQLMAVKTVKLVKPKIHTIWFNSEKILA